MVHLTTLLGSLLLLVAVTETLGEKHLLDCSKLKDAVGDPAKSECEYENSMCAGGDSDNREICLEEKGSCQQEWKCTVGMDGTDVCVEAGEYKCACDWVECERDDDDCLYHIAGDETSETKTQLMSIFKINRPYTGRYQGEKCDKVLEIKDTLLTPDGNALWSMSFDIFQTPVNITLDGGSVSSSYISHKMQKSAMAMGITTACISLAVSVVFAVIVMKAHPGEGEMVELADIIHNGAKDFLHAEYTWLVVFVAVIFIAVTCLLVGSITPEGVSKDTFGIWTAIPLLFGAFFSASAGYGGMWIATKANVRTAHACDPSADGSISKGLAVAFKSGAVMSLSVCGLGLLGITVFYSIYATVFPEAEAWQYLSGYGFGASCIALFARVGGGCYTKAADVGADLVGKVESNIPEDHPNNAAVIADNVGDNVGDVAGMGADLFESYVGSIIAACTLATTQFTRSSLEHCFHEAQDKFPNMEGDCVGFQKSAIVLPFWIAGTGIVCSIIGTLLVRTNATLEESDTDEGKRNAETELLEKLLKTINHAIWFSGFLVLGCAAMSCWVLFSDTLVAGKIFSCIAIGLVSGNLIGMFTEYSTSYTFSPTQNIAAKSRTGPATVIIQGLGVGMVGTIVPTVIIVIAICACNALAGLYGIAIAAVGMLSTLGITLATDAYGPVADNAGGIAEMASLTKQTRENTDSLDAMGNTTAATGKGFAIGSAVLTSVALIAAFMDAAGLRNERVSIREPVVLSGLLIGGSLPFVFAAITMLSVGKAAEAIIVTVRQHFLEKPELKTNLESKELRQWMISEGKYEEVIKIATQASIKEMVIPGAIAVFMPIIVGLLLSSKGLTGMLIGALSSGFMLAVAMSNAGGAWDNAKKYLEKGMLLLGDGEYAQKGSDEHDAVVTGDTVGDPFKDTSGPALNILIKLMSVISLVIAPALKTLQFDSETHEFVMWEPRSVGIGAAILIVLLVVCYFLQRMIDAGYAKQSEKVQYTKQAVVCKSCNNVCTSAECTTARGGKNVEMADMAAKPDSWAATAQEVTFAVVAAGEEENKTKDGGIELSLRDDLSVSGLNDEMV